jgi:hypothetical protein
MVLGRLQPLLLLNRKLLGRHTGERDDDDLFEFR